MDRYEELQQQTRNWKPPAELRGTGDRDVQLSRGGIVLAVFAGILMLGGVGAAIALDRIGLEETAQQQRLNEQGKDTQGTILRLWRANDKEHVPMVMYEFEASGRKYHRSVRTPLHVWRGLKEGMPLPVRYLPLNPVESHPRDWSKEPLPMWVGILVGTGMVSGGIILVFVLRRQLALLRDGRPAPAIVTRHAYAGKGQKNFHYEFAVMSGATAKGKSGPRRKLPAIGETVTILYDRDNPKRNSPYPIDVAMLRKS
jgi:hypothetical protein